MNGEAILFYLFAAVAIGGAIGVVAQKNPMYGALSLLSTFLAVAGLFVLRHAEFVGVVQIFVYGGGIMVLFLFVIMLVNLQKLDESERVWRQTPFALLASLAFAGLFGLLRHASWRGAPDAATRLQAIGEQSAGNPKALAWVLFRDDLAPFEIASLFLLVAMIGAVVLGRRD